MSAARLLEWLAENGPERMREDARVTRRDMLAQAAEDNEHFARLRELLKEARADRDEWLRVAIENSCLWCGRGAKGLYFDDGRWWHTLEAAKQVSTRRVLTEKWCGADGIRKAIGQPPQGGAS